MVVCCPDRNVVRKTHDVVPLCSLNKVGRSFFSHWGEDEIARSQSTTAGTEVAGRKYTGHAGNNMPESIIPSMDTTEIIQTIDAEIARLEKARALLSGDTASPTKRGRPLRSTTTDRSKPRRRMSAAGRARIAAAQKARWAKAKKTNAD